MKNYSCIDGKKREYISPPSNGENARLTVMLGGLAGRFATRPPPNPLFSLCYLTRVRRRWIKMTSTMTKRTPATTRTIVVVSISQSPISQVKNACACGVHLMLRLLAFQSDSCYLTRVRRRWIKMTSTMTKRTPATTRTIVVVSIWTLPSFSD